MGPLQVFRAFMAVGVLNIVQYRSDFVIAVLNAIISLATQIIGLSVIFSHTTDLRGWTPEAMLVLIGIHFFISGLIGVVVRPSMEALMEGVRLGTFDFLLTKPADAQLLASVQRIAPQSLTDVALGMAVVLVGVTRAGLRVGPTEIALFMLSIAAGFGIVYGFLLLLSTMVFWLIRLDNVLVIFQSVFGSAGRWPVTIFPGWLRPVLTFVVPIAFAVTVPAQALSGQLSPANVVLSLAVAAVFLIGSRVFWLVALRHYTGASA